MDKDVTKGSHHDLHLKGDFRRFNETRVHLFNKLCEHFGDQMTEGEILSRAVKLLAEKELGKLEAMSITLQFVDQQNPGELPTADQAKSPNRNSLPDP